MNFAIEVPGAANPLSIHDLFRTLEEACGHDNSKRQAASQQLSSWESHSEYYSALQTIFLTRDGPRDIRLSAIIQLKNGIDRYWRHHSLKTSIDPAARERIRSQLFRGTVGEPDPQLAFYNALVIAKIVRVDFPDDWPDALSKVIELLRTNQDGDPRQLYGALLILLRIVKELGTARLRRSQTALQSVTPELVYVLGGIYGAKSTAWIGFLSTQQGEQEHAKLAMQNSLMAFKILRRLLIVGYDYPDKDNTVQQVWTFSQTQFAQCLSFASRDNPFPAPFDELVGKHLLQFAKLHVEMADVHAGSFPSLPNSLDLVRAYWDLVANFAKVYDKSGGIRQGGAPSDDAKPKVQGPLLERLALKGLLLIRFCIRMVYRPKQTIRYRSKEIVEEQKQAIEHVKANLFKDDLVIQMANTIITHLFVFRKADLEAWEEDPQEWEQQEESQGNAYEWEVRPCAEKLFLDLLTYHKPLLLQPLLSYFATATSSGADVIAKEAVYTAMGLAAPLVENDFDFDAMLRTTVVPDAQQSGHLSQILRRRIPILLSQWVPIRISVESRPVVYEIFRHFLNRQDQTNDIVVRITAARQFKPVVDEFGFDGELFMPFASDVLPELVDILQQVEVDETRLAILETTRSLIQRMESHVSEHGDFVMSALPEIWSSAGDLGFMVKQSVLAIIQSLITSMKTSSERYQDVILPLIAEATQENTEMYLYLIEEALELWSNVLSQSQPPLSQALLDLAGTSVKQLGDANEHSFTYVCIVGSYIILAPETLLGDGLRRPLIGALSSAFDSKNREQLSTATKYTEYVVRLSHQLGGTRGLQTIIEDMMETGLLKKIFEGIHDSYEVSQMTGPKKRHAAVGALTLMDYFCILSRIAVAEVSIFAQLIASLGPLDVVWQWLGEVWFSVFDSIADMNRSKLNMMALTRLLELPQPMQDLVLTKLQDYFTMWTSVMLQIIDDDENPGHDMLVITPEEIVPTEWDTPKDVRERELFKTDPVKTVESLTFVKERLHTLVQQVGGEQPFQENYVVNVDKEIIQGFQAIGTPRPKEG
ncbi:putative importin 11 [Xylariomycetidae sp. FL2044]|nr:putative importin 11 [Xylariomycetidae sp. FL2044]